MPKDLHQRAERNRKIDALRCAPTAKPPTFPNSLRSVIKRRCETSVFLRFSPKARRLDLSLPHRPTGAITDSAPNVRRERCPSNPKVKHNRSLVVQQSAHAARLHNPDYVNCLPQCGFDRPASETAPSGRLATLNSLQGPTASRPVREFRTSGVMCVGDISNSSAVRTLPLSSERRPEVQGVANLSSTAAGLLRDFFKSSSGALYFKKSLRQQGIGFRR